MLLMGQNLSRRRFLSLSAGVTSLGLMPLPLSAASPLLRRWSGAALGGPASIAVHHPDPGTADQLIGRCIAELGRLENIFSLYRPDSALCRLNRDGYLDGPPSDLVVLLSECIWFSRLTGGAFDVTVQPLWRLYADHFSRTNAPAEGPGRDAVERALDLVGHDGLLIDADHVSFARKGMAVTLNGIAQGFITDRIAEILRSGGCDSVLADLGEIRALGTHPSGHAWRVGLADPWVPDRIARAVEIKDQAVATSAATGFQFEFSGRFHHLLDPATGSSAGHYASVTVVAHDATTADALSTALTLMPIAEADRVLRDTAGSVALLTYPDGKTQTHKGDRRAS
jgi:thiamine biosynthesis lipoprotein